MVDDILYFESVRSPGEEYRAKKVRSFGEENRAMVRSTCEENSVAFCTVTVNTVKKLATKTSTVE